MLECTTEKGASRCVEARRLGEALFPGELVVLDALLQCPPDMGATKCVEARRLLDSWFPQEPQAVDVTLECIPELGASRCVEARRLWDTWFPQESGVLCSFPANPSEQLKGSEHFRLRGVFDSGEGLGLPDGVALLDLEQCTQGVSL